MVLTHADVFTGMMLGTALTYYDVTCFCILSTPNLNAKALAGRLTAVLRTTYTFFMCHIFLAFLGLCYYFLDQKLCELLAVTVQLTVTFSSSLVENQDLVTLYQSGLDFTYNLCAFNGRSTDGNLTVLVSEKDLFKLYRSTCFSILNVVHEQLHSLFNLELLSLNFSNNVHLSCFYSLCPTGGPST